MGAKSAKADQELFGEFSSSAYPEWRVAAERVLRGASLDTLEAKIWEGIKLQPIYHEGEQESLRGELDLGPVLRSGSDDPLWRISQELALPRPDQFNAYLLKALERGQDEINVVLARPGQQGLRLGSHEDFSTAFKGVWPDAVSYRFQVGGLATLQLFQHWLDEADVDCSRLSGSLGADPFGGDPLTQFVECARHCVDALPEFRAVLVDSMDLHEAGGSAVEELGASLAAGISTVRELCDAGLEVTDAAAQISFRLAVGSDFFCEIAKFRAMRVLWRQVVMELGGPASAAITMLHGRTGRYGKAQRQAETNLVRATTEALSAVIGGVDSLCVGPFDETLGRGSELGHRVAATMQLVLREECGMTVRDAAAGSYYVEVLTEEIAQAGWEFMQDIEASGGYRKCLAQGMIAERVGRVHEKRTRALAERRTTLVGVNRYCYGEEKNDPLQVKELQRAGAEFSPRRLGEDFEALQQAETAAPRLGILPLGSLDRCRVRIEFVRDYFSSGGFEFEELDDENSKFTATVIVICSASDITLDAVGEVVKSLKSRANPPTVLAAMKPGSGTDALLEAGLNDFVFEGSNNYEMNRSLLLSTGGLSK